MTPSLGARSTSAEKMPQSFEPPGSSSLDKVISAIYAAIEEPELWNVALAEFASATGAMAAQLLLWDPNGGQTGFVGMSPLASGEGRNGCTDTSAKERSQLTARLLMGVPWLGLPKSAAAPPEWSDAPQAKARCVELWLYQNPTGAMLGVYRCPRQQAFGGDEMARVQTLASHFRLALRMQQRIAAQDHKLELMGRVLDHLGQAVILVDRACRILHSNQRATELLSIETGSSNPFDILLFNDPGDQKTLRKAISESFRHGAGVPFALSNGDEQQLDAAVLLLAAGVGSDLQLRQQVAAIVVSKPTEASTIKGRQLMELFNLTATEAGLAIELFHGKRVAEVAMTRKVSLSTVRAQLRAVLAKTETHRQLDLVRLLSRITDCGAPAR